MHTKLNASILAFCFITAILIADSGGDSVQGLGGTGSAR